MEHAEQISEEWSSLSGFYTDEEADFMIQLLSNCSVPQELYGNANLGISSAFWPSHESTIVSVTGNSDSLYFPSNAASTDSTNIFATTNGGNYSLNGPVTNFGSMSMGFSLGDAKFSPYSVQFSQQINEITDEDSGPDPGKEVLSDNNLQDKRDCQILVSEPAEEDKSSNMENSAKRSRSSKEISKNRRNLKSKKNPKSSSTSNKEEDKSHGLQGQNSSSCCSSDDDSSASQELNGGTSSCLSPKSNTALKSNGKSRSNRGAATDPQSLYARRRRERINERLRILQNLVPNGTKVDISTMLEEAVQYVKFLQLQIKLLSSDDLWMYAPIAYNGLNIGLDLNITATKQP